MDAFDELLLLDKTKAHTCSATKSRVSVQQQVSHSPSVSSAVRVGRPSFVSKFPYTVNIATDFGKANGFSGHE